MRLDVLHAKAVFPFQAMVKSKMCTYSEPINQDA